MAATDFLADKTIRATAESGGSGRQTAQDQRRRGLVLEARPAGAGWWRLRFWRDGKKGLFSLGSYPEASLKDARRRRDDIRKLVAADKDPSEHRKTEKAERARARESKALADGAVRRAGRSVAQYWLQWVTEGRRGPWL